MPHFRFRAMTPEQVQQLSIALVDDLQDLMDCRHDDFTIEHVPTTFFLDGKPASAWPFVEVLYFDRGEVTQDKIAETVTRLVRSVIGDPEQDVAVVFTHLDPENYYDNGVHY